MKKILIGLVLVVLIFTGCSGGNSQKGSETSEKAENQSAQKLSKLPSFELKDLDGEIYTEESFKNKVLLIDFWATWCPPCRKEIPGFINLYKKYKDKGLEVIGISLDEDINKLESFVEEEQINYTVLIGNKEVAQAFGGIQGIPTTFIVDRDGNVVFKQVGLASEKKFEQQIKKVLDK
ncbi:MAG: TlpA family protein disulfide reductase [Candidatus Mcinerneyibacterium aminivorans]|uniref:TlpA family protein disulfide reductase n=1 Tax=Candidatus Mcinerneyibacterium aminivorans TaxID=2703815 RepID=A0A5D0MK83_9BACT|nr:MAG: TlpA family protein disulfide reductase [Candidatus Mcinerneyibacterium aminivorans]